MHGPRGGRGWCRGAQVALIRSGCTDTIRLQLYDQIAVMRKQDSEDEDGDDIGQQCGQVALLVIPKIQR